jgi:hypothetical protein
MELQNPLVLQPTTGMVVHFLDWSAHSKSSHVTHAHDREYMQALLKWAGGKGILIIGHYFDVIMQKQDLQYSRILYCTRKLHAHVLYEYIYI